MRIGSLVPARENFNPAFRVQGFASHEVQVAAALHLEVDATVLGLYHRKLTKHSGLWHVAGLENPVEPHSFT